MYAASAARAIAFCSFHHRGRAASGGGSGGDALFSSTVAWQGRRTAPGGGWCSSLSHRFQAVVRLRFFRFYLEESKLPTAWYNVRADMKNKPAPLLNPGTLKPMTARELDGVFCDELVQQELDDTTA